MLTLTLILIPATWCALGCQCAAFYLDWSAP
jgi:hypothetical protein